MNLITEKITAYCIKTDLIDSKDAGLYKYCFDYIAENVLFIIINIMIGFFSGAFLEALFFLTVLYPVRAAYGGVHAPTKTVCNFLSYLYSGIAITVIPEHPIPPLITTILFTSATVLILITGPVDTPNKRFNSSLLTKLKRRSKAITLLLTVTFIFLIIIEKNIYAFILTYVFLSTLMCCLLGFLLKRRSKMNIAICDDDKKMIRTLVNHIKKMQMEREVAVKISVKAFHSAEEFKASSQDGLCYDIIFLDVEMPGMTGLELAQAIRNKKNFKTQIVFISSYPDYISKSFNVEAFDYILKPVEYDNFCTLWKRLEKRLERDNFHSIVIENSELTEFINLNDISYVQIAHGRRGYINIYPFDQSIDKKNVKSTLKDISDLLHQHYFAQCSKDTIVNTRYIYKIKNNDIILKNGCSVRLSRHYEKSFRKYISDNTLKLFRGGTTG